MPIYDFQCSACGHSQEVMRKVNAPNIDQCPQCKQDTFAKQLSAPSFQLNGTGWYATDFKGGSAKPEKKAEDTAAAPAACNTGCACH